VKLSVKFFFKFFLSIFAIFHVTLIIVLANGPSILGRLNPPWLIDYANQMGFNQTWNFFSPDPSHINYIHYLVFFDSNVGNSTTISAEVKEPVEGFIPEQLKTVELDSSKRRMLHAVRYMSLDESRTEKLMAPWLCKKFPGATHVRLKHILDILPNLDQASIDPDRPLEDLIQSKPYRTVEFDCPSSLEAPLTEIDEAGG